MERCSNSGESSQRRERVRRERVSRKKITVREKVEMSRNTVFSQCFVAPEGRQVGSLRAFAARFSLVKTMVGCGAIWWEERGHNARRCGAKHMSTWTCPKHPNVGASFEVAMWEKCTRLWRKARVQVKCFKHLNLVVLLEGCFFQKCTQVWGKAKWREAHSEVNMSKAPHVGSSFGRSRVVFHGRRNGFCTLSKVSKMWRFCSSCKNDGEGLPRCISPGRRSTRDRHVKRSGRWFPERGCILENLFRFAKIILRDRCSPSYDLA